MKSLALFLLGAVPGLVFFILLPAWGDTSAVGRWTYATLSRGLLVLCAALVFGALAQWGAAGLEWLGRRRWFRPPE